MSFVDEEEVVIGGFLKAFLEAALGVDSLYNFVNGPGNFALVGSTEKACCGTHFCLKWESDISRVVDVFEETFTRSDIDLTAWKCMALVGGALYLPAM